MSDSPELTITVQDSGKVVARTAAEQAVDGRIDDDPELLAILESLRDWLTQGQLTIKLESELMRVGALLNRVLLGSGGSKVRNLVEQALGDAQYKGAPIRIQLEFQAEQAALSTLPWEFLYNPTAKCFWAWTNNLVLVRFNSEGPGKREQLDACELPLRVLIVVSRKGGGPVVAQKSIDAIKKVITDRPEALELVDEVLDDLSAGAIQARLRTLKEKNKRPHLVHFIGHGRYNHVRRQGEVALPDAKGDGVRWVNQEQFKRLFSDSECIPRLLFLQTCEVGTIAAGGLVNTFEGLVPALISMNVQAVVAMQFPISNEYATTMCGAFYEELSKGQTVGDAVRTARLRTVVDDPVAAGTPVLYMYGHDGAIVSPRPVPTQLADRAAAAGYGGAVGGTSTPSAAGPPQMNRVTAPDTAAESPPPPATQPSAAAVPATATQSAALDRVREAGSAAINAMTKGIQAKDLPPEILSLNWKLHAEVIPALRSMAVPEMRQALADRFRGESNSALATMLKALFDSLEGM